MVKIINLKKNSFESAKISAKKSKLLTDNKIKELSTLSFDEIIKYLEEHDFQKAVDTSYLQFNGFYLIERILNIHTSRIYSEVFKTASNNNKILLEKYYLKYQIHNLISLIRCKLSGEKEFEVYLIGDDRKKEKFIKAFEMSNLEDSISYITKKLKFNVTKVLQNYKEGVFHLENYLYKQYYEELNSYNFKFNNIDEKKFFNFIKTYIDLINARTYLRLKAEENTKLNFKEIFIIGGEINLDFFTKLNSLKLEEMKIKFDEKFKNLKNNIVSENSLIDFDKKINLHKSNANKTFKNISFGSAFYSLKFLFEVEDEIRKLRILLKAKFLKLTDEEIKGLI